MHGRSGSSLSSGLSSKLSLAEANFEAAAEASALKSFESSQVLEAVQAVQVASREVQRGPLEMRHG